MNEQNLCQEILETLLGKLGLSSGVTANQQGETLVLTISSEHRGVLIGFHGENLTSLQNILRLMVFRRTGNWIPVVVDVGGYRLERAQKLSEMTERSAQKARFLNTEVSLPPMSSSDRREVHLALSSLEGVVGESVGEGSNRHIVIRPSSLV